MTEMQRVVQEFYELLLSLDVPFCGREHEDLPSLRAEDAAILRQMPAGIREVAHLERRAA